MRALFALPLVALPACLDTDGGSDDNAEFVANDMELALHDLVNDHRLSIGLEPLEFDGGFGALAREHSTAMAAGAVEFGHDGFDARADEMAVQQPTLAGVGENVAYISGGLGRPGRHDRPGLGSTAPVTGRTSRTRPGTHGGDGRRSGLADGW
jgi:Uncharacterized protein with SCP/PR1 domains